MPEPPSAKDQFRDNIRSIIDLIQLELYGKINEARRHFKEYIETGDESFLEKMWKSIPEPSEHNVTKDSMFEWARSQLTRFGPGTEYDKLSKELDNAETTKKELETRLNEIVKQIRSLCDKMQDYQ